MNTFYKVGFFVLLIAVVAGGAYYFGAQKQGITPQSAFTKVSPAPTDVSNVQPLTGTPQPTNPAGPTREDVKTAIRVAVDNKNYNPLAEHMADTVNVVLESSECCGALSKSDAIKQLSYIDSANGPWGFDDNSPNAVKLRATDPADYGPDTSIIGIAASNQVAAFKLNAENKIIGITLSVDYHLTIP